MGALQKLEIQISILRGVHKGASNQGGGLILGDKSIHFDCLMEIKG